MESAVQEKPVLIEKETISTLKFPHDEVLKTPLEIAERTTKLRTATSLGNLEKHKVQIVFKDSEGLKMVHTTVWSITEHNIILKYNNNIPVHRIVDIIPL
jgi:uncharacterized protein (UPF0248 family)